MKHSKPRSLLITDLSTWTGFSNKPVLFLTTLVLLFSVKSQSQFSSPFQAYYTSNSNNITIGAIEHNRSVKWILNPEQNIAKWETLQSIEVSQASGATDLFRFMPPVKLNIDQVRNGSADAPSGTDIAAPWVNGNAGASNAHYVEGYSIPYRVVVDNLVGNSARSVTIEYDIRQSNSSAIDFMTHYDMIDYPANSHFFNFGHNKEIIDPRVNDGMGNANTYKIEDPTFVGAPAAVAALFNTINDDGILGQLSIWNGTITDMEYLSQGNVLDAAAKTRVKIYFTNSASTVVISWGGHIAKGDGCWGAGNSASAVSGSPYHTRLIEWDPDGAGEEEADEIGNQDRSLSADAVLDPPICQLGDPITVECTSSFTVTSGLATSDLTGGSTFEWSISGSGGSLGATNNVSSVNVTITGGCGSSFNVIFKILKSGNEVSRCTKNVYVNDTQAPTISCASNSSISCPATPSFSTPSASDNCGATTLTSSDQSTAGGCAGSYTVTRKWTAQDACNNTATCSQTIEVKDLVAPVISGVGTGGSINCPSTPVFSNPTASDACGASTLTSADVSSDVTCPNRYTVTRTWTARDGCNNTSTASETITVRDNTPPVISGVGIAETIDCPATPSFSNPTATDACGAATLTSADVSAAGSCVNSYSTTRKWTATDACGNTSTASQTIFVRDITAPVISGVGGPSSVSCPTTPTFSNPTATDACGDATLTSADVTTAGSCPNNYFKTRKWTAKDACNNTSTASQTIEVRDITPPVITCPADLTVECDVSTVAGGAVGSASATDACGPVTITSSDQVANPGCITVITRTWTARDACGNTVNCVQHIIQRDETPPTIQCNSSGAATITDNCTPPASIVSYKVGDVWTAIDGSGNIKTASCPAAPLRVNNSSSPTMETTAQTVTTKTEEKTLPALPPRSTVITKDVTVQAIPNPFNDRVKFVVTSPQAGYATLDVMNMLGQKVKTVFQGRLSAGQQSFEMVLPRNNTTLFYTLKVNGKQVTGKLVQASGRN